MEKIESSKENMLIESYGGTGGLVTGSSHLLEIKGSKILVDMGMFQGHKDENAENGDRRNFTPLTEMARGLSDVLVTHAHIDHIGRLPMIYQKGFRPRTLATEATVDFMDPMLYNSAEIQSSDRNVENRLYGMNDVETTLRHVRGVSPFKEIQVGQNNSGISAEFLLNGHVMGSSSILIRNPHGNKNILFTGDMGKPIQSLCGGYTDFMARYPQDPINVLVVESTNFEKEPIPFKNKEEELVGKINETFADGGNVVIPVLSYHRTPEILEMLFNAKKSGKLSSEVKIILDGPLSVKLMDVSKELGSDYISRRYGDDPDFYKTDEESLARFDLKDVSLINSHKDSVKNDSEVAQSGSKTITLASGGMAEHGRSINYLKGKFGRNPKNLILFTCFQVEGTRGANMMCRKENSKEKITGAKVYQVEGFTSHISGAEETFDFLERFNLEKLETVIICHGRNSSREKMAQEFKTRGYGKKIINSDIGQSIRL